MSIRRPTFSILAAIAAVALLTSCGQEDAPDDGSEPGGGSTPSVTATPDPAGSAGTPAPQSAVDQAITLLAEQLSVAPEQIEVASSAEVTWPDGAIGCPEKDMGYTQALVPGSKIELVVDGETYAFHQDGTKPPFYCANPTDPVPES